MSERASSGGAVFLPRDEESTARDRLREVCFGLIAAASLPATDPPRPPVCLVAEALAEWFVEGPITVGWSITDRSSSRRYRGEARVDDLGEPARLLDGAASEALWRQWVPSALPEVSPRARARSEADAWRLQICRRPAAGQEERLMVVLPVNTPDARAWMRRTWIATCAQGVGELATTLVAVRALAGSGRALTAAR